ncbi:YceI family protein [Plebeiibacterium sediminum]|uniref:YceI family protein n=1 Tax=Plebeiibacterium sediminum TaxID=2992112 RepID=A0AAE3SH52_9BACT|nr:YceI family protein [Plebeiobacterium sediminum]MCW3789178.1 YceI family protein [Plebeiobacterium sediminum]
MKTLKIVIVLLIAGSVSVFAQKKEVKSLESVVKWTGNKIGGSHNGEIKVKNGYLEFNNDQITSGKVVIDMNSITDLDLEDEGYNQKLVGHLKSDDFFGVEKFPTSSFEVTKASKFKDGKASVTGTLTIKGKSEEITFDIVKKGNEYITKLEVDRSKFDVRYGSGSFFDNLGDKVIDDIFILDIKLSI